MKATNFKILLVLFSVLFTGITINAQKTDDRKIVIEKQETLKFVNKTNNILFITGNKIRKNKVYTGCFYKAKKYQKEAMELFNKQKFKQSVEKSYKARRYTMIAFEENKGKIPEKWQADENEKKLVDKIFQSEITDEELKNEVKNSDKKSEENDFKGNKGKKKDGKGKTN